tara:strand:- start:3476 stop:3973 length:498 start_codon:yes stop_codon:yes gene_type:complete
MPHAAPELYRNNNKENDNRNTPQRAWEDILQYIPPKTKLWLPFYNDGMALKIVNNLGYKNVTHVDKDFFTYDISDAFVIDNPPYTIKSKIIDKLNKTNRPFALLLPLPTVGRQYIKKYKNNLQILIPYKRYNFLSHTTVTPPFKCCWFCWNMERYLDTKDKLIWL